MKIDAEDVDFRELNERIHAALRDDVSGILLENVRGQRYIGAGLGPGVRVTIDGVPGNDLGAFMDGAELVVRGNAQDGVGNTMNSGSIVVHGDAGDIAGYSMRGGRIFVRGSVGYRAGIHMKAYRERVPVLVVGGTTGDYLGEYMAGGILVVLGIGAEGTSAAGEWVGTGMHGGVIYLRGGLEAHQTGAEVGMDGLDEAEWATLSGVLDEYRDAFDLEDLELKPDDFVKLFPQTTRPYGALYAY
ncbi:MAG: hypothetical protein PVJ27_05775 [Candidatus Brocadiaceae bacterium]|jgi:glutamate synthase domain-containing protein 3